MNSTPSEPPAYSLPATRYSLLHKADACLALLWLHLITAGPHGSDPNGPATRALFALPSRLRR